MYQFRKQATINVSRTSHVRVALILAVAGITAFGTTSGAHAAFLAAKPKAAKACAKGTVRNAARACVKASPTTTAAKTSSPVSTTAAKTAAVVSTTAPSTAGPASTTALASGASAQRDKIVVTFPVEPDGIDAYTGENRFEFTQMYETLMIRDTSGVLQPWLLAEKPKNTDPFSLEWDLKVRSDVTFHDGTPLTAQSIVDQVNWAKSVKGITELGGASGMPALTSATVTSTNTAHFIYASPQPLLTTQFTYFKVQKIVNGKPVAIGTGPFKLVDFTRGQRFTMTVNDKYWGTKSNVKNIEMRYIPDPAARVAALTAGEVDLITQISVEDSKRVPQLISTDGSLLMYRIQLNNRDGVTFDVRVRQALNYAIDKEAMIKAFFDGQAALDNCQSLTPGMTGYDPSLKAYPYDPAKAKALIKSAGADGMSVDLYQAAERWTKGTEIVQAVAQMWSDVGIKTTVKNVPFTQWLEVAQKQPGPRPDSFFVGANLRLQDGSDLRGYLVSTPTDGTISSVSDRQIDKMMNDASAIADEGQRNKAFQVLSNKICRDATFAYLFSPKILTGVSKGISFQADPRGERWFSVHDFSFTK